MHCFKAQGITYMFLGNKLLPFAMQSHSATSHISLKPLKTTIWQAGPGYTPAPISESVNDTRRQALGN